MSPRGRAAVARLERTRFWAGAAAEALRAWSLFMRDPAYRLFDPSPGCGLMMCCPDPVELRAILYAVLTVLPPRDARALRKRVHGFDGPW
ncbi:hypothetical protein ACTWPT_36310 [Nonomuraea sp. 3N208]|uniref:hypothetical protein n=1 Tax=Nonomuraea sp. 3N208 TaxID=3457421 RepID=UPI003FD4715E